MNADSYQYTIVKDDCELIIYGNRKQPIKIQAVRNKLAVIKTVDNHITQDVMAFELSDREALKLCEIILRTKVTK